MSNETVTVAVPGGLGFADAWKGPLDEWSQQTGAKYRIVEYPVEATAARGLASGELPSGDLFIIPFTQLGDFVANDRLSPMPPNQFGTDSPTGWLDIFSGVRERMLSVGGAPTLLPLSCPVLACYLRRDLLEKAGLKPPETWDDYQTLADAVPKWAPGLSVVEPWGSDFRATMFLARALSWVKNPGNYSAFFDIETGAPLIDSAGFVQALTQAVDSVAKMPAEVKNLSPADCRRLILSGKAAMAICFEPGRTDAALVERAKGISLSFVRLPGARQVFNRDSDAWEEPARQEGGQGPNYATLAPFAGLTAAVSKRLPEARAQAAWSLADFLCLDHYEQAFANASKSVFRESQLAGAAPWFSRDLRSEEVFGYLGVTAESLRQSNISPDLVVVGREKFRQALTDGLTAALEKKATPAAALKGVAERWNALIKEIGVDRVRDSYRKCLGLPAAMKIPELKGGGSDAPR